MVGSHPGILLKLGGMVFFFSNHVSNHYEGFRHGSMSFHPSIKGVGLYHTPEAPYQFKDFIAGVIKDWDFDNICAAHMGT